jgi:hypothetical protein
MPNHVRIFDGLDAFFTEQMKKALLTDDIINMPDWIDDMANWMVQLMQSVPKEKRAGLKAFAHERIDYYARQKDKH